MNINMILYILQIILYIIISAVLYIYTGIGKWFYHDILHWHTPGNNQEYFNGCSIVSTCKYCGEKITQDGQGNWY